MLLLLSNGLRSNINLKYLYGQNQNNEYSIYALIERRSFPSKKYLNSSSIVLYKSRASSGLFFSFWPSQNWSTQCHQFESDKSFKLPNCCSKNRTWIEIDSHTIDRNQLCWRQKRHSLSLSSTNLRKVTHLVFSSFSPFFSSSSSHFLVISLAERLLTLVWFNTNAKNKKN